MALKDIYIASVPDNINQGTVYVNSRGEDISVFGVRLEGCDGKRAREMFNEQLPKKDETCVFRIMVSPTELVSALNEAITTSRNNDAREIRKTFNDQDMFDYLSIN